MEQNENKAYTASDYKNGQTARWCPGCGDHAILNVLHKAMAELGVPPHMTAVISGIGCSSRLPYYMNTYENPAIEAYPMDKADLDGSELYVFA